MNAGLLSEVCCDVGVEPALQPLDHEPLRHATANREDGARLDVARDFWGRNRQRAFLTLGCLILLHAPILVSHCQRVTRYKKRRAYDERIREVERACFSPLVFAATGGMGPSATTVFRKLASMLADKWSVNFSRCLFSLRCRLCFSLLRSGVMCLRDHRSSTFHPIPSVDLAYSEGCLTSGAFE